MIDLKNPVYTSPWQTGFEWKHALLLHLAKKFNLKTFIETGTHWGGTLKAMQPHFDQLYSIELSEKWYKHAVSMFSSVWNIYPIQGDSATELPKLLEKISVTPTLFWLDAHYSGGDTALAPEDPLKAEVQTIIRMRPDALIVIDDMQPGDHLGTHGNPAGWTALFHGGVVLMHKGLYDITFN
jgi:hypothetical protein